MMYPLFYHEIGVSDLIQITVLIKRTKKKKKEKRKKKKKIVRVINILLRLMRDNELILFMRTTKCGLVAFPPPDKALGFDWVCSPVRALATSTPCD